SPSQYTPSNLSNLSGLASLPDPSYPQTSLPPQFPPHQPFFSDYSNPLASSSTSIGGGRNGLDSFDLGDDFFALTSASAANKSAVVNNPHIPAEVNQAASEVWQNFSGITPVSLENPIGAGVGGNRSSWNLSGGPDIFGDTPGGLPTNGLNPFSDWNFSSSSEQTPRNEIPNNQWNYYDSNAFGSTN
ncbi:hypothetical protein JCM5350_002721, partial [Sporobolomyces pararoseus]